MTQAKTVKCKASYCAHRVQLKAEKTVLHFPCHQQNCHPFSQGFLMHSGT